MTTKKKKGRFNALRSESLTDILTSLNELEVSDKNIVSFLLKGDEFIVVFYI